MPTHLQNRLYPREFRSDHVTVTRTRSSLFADLETIQEHVEQYHLTSYACIIEPDVKVSNPWDEIKHIQETIINSSSKLCEGVFMITTCVDYESSTKDVKIIESLSSL
jgi:hypothetical protein